MLVLIVYFLGFRSVIHATKNIRAMPKNVPEKNSITLMAISCSVIAVGLLFLSGPICPVDYLVISLAPILSRLLFPYDKWLVAAIPAYIRLCNKAANFNLDVTVVLYKQRISILYKVTDEQH
jgi:hypothetical protein